MEHSRHLLEKEGVRLAAVSYDAVETLRAFAEKYKIGFPLLSDRDSAVIRAFRIFNSNMAPDVRAYGVPHPVEYLVGPDGVVVRKYFVPNYQHRVTGAEVALREFGATDADARTVRVHSGAVTIEIGLASATAFAGQELGFFAKFAIEPGWHTYGTPLPEGYTATLVAFDDPKVIGQSFELPAATPTKTASLGEIVPLYGGSFEGRGSLLLKFPLAAGETTLAGEVRFQQCSDTVCEAPERMRFELTVTLGKFVTAD